LRLAFDRALSCHDGGVHDQASIRVQAGAGGDGCTSFRREAHVPRGGPDGGDGGRGGDVVVVCDGALRDLASFRHQAHYRAGRGGHGEGALRHGAAGETLTVAVPPGTVVSVVPGPASVPASGAATGARGRPGAGTAGEGAGTAGEASLRDGLGGRRWELLEDGQRATVARGGAGGRGNKAFATATRQAPRFAERGLPGEEGWLKLRLKLLADVGLVGLPNAGKSSLLARLTRAAPKVADYPFTTLAPVLGVLEDAERRQLVLADIPGLIEGASEGAGLGHDFLAHVERTRLLVHVLDLAPELTAGEGADAGRNHATIERELQAHDPRLASLPRVLALSKADLVDERRAEATVAEWSERLGPGVPVIATSSATGAGLKELAGALLAHEALRAPLRAPALGDARYAGESIGAGEGMGTNEGIGEGERVRAGGEGARGGGMDARARLPAGREGEQLAEHMVFRPAAERGFRAERTGPHAFAVRGRGIEKLLARHDLDNEDALAYLEERLHKIGVLSALRDAGFQAGDELRIGDVAFELDPDAPA
jgi:GTP-binding protein